MRARLPVSLLAMVAALLLAACTDTTTFTSTWKAPDGKTVSPVGKTVVAVFVSRNEGQRRAAEDMMAADLTARGAHGVPGYTILPSPPDGQHIDVDKALAALKASGADAAVVMRVVGKDQRVSYVAGSTGPYYGGGFGPYWGYGWGRAYDPGYLRTDTDVSVETQVYALKQDKLLWASTSRTTNPDDLNKLLQDVVRATTKEMTRQGFLATG